MFRAEVGAEEEPASGVCWWRELWEVPEEVDEEAGILGASWSMVVRMVCKGSSGSQLST